jgi:hypothetical protein
MRFGQKTNMTEGPKKTEEKPRKPEKRRSVSESVRRQEIKVVELGVTEDEWALMEEISVQIDNLAGPRGRIDPYIAHFSRYFRDGAMDLADWRADKAIKNRRKKWIRIDIRNVRIFEPGADGTVRVRFLQNYESANYRDSTEKTLVLDREGGQWKIIGFGGESDNR